MNFRLLCSIIPTAKVVGPRSLLQCEGIVRHPCYIQTLVHEHYVPTLRLVRARIELNYSRDDLRRYNQHTSRQCYTANGIDAPTHVALYSLNPLSFAVMVLESLATSRRILGGARMADQ